MNSIMMSAMADEFVKIAHNAKVAQTRLAVPARMPRQASFTPAVVGTKGTVAPPPVAKPAPPKNGPLNPGGMMMH